MLARLVNLDRASGGLVPSIPLTFSEDYGVFLRTNNLDDSDKNRVLFLLYFVGQLIIVGNIVMNYTPELLVGSAQVQLTQPQIDSNQALTDDAAVVLTSLRSTVPCATQWLIDLTAAHQMSRLDMKNVKNYFAACDGMVVDNKSVIEYLDYFKSKLPKIMSDIDARAVRSNSLWVQYHTNFSTSPSLAKRFYEALPLEFAALISTADRAIIEEAVLEPWDMNKTALIPPRVLALANIYFSEMKVDIGNWYQGNRAESLMAPDMIVHTRSVFKKMILISKDTVAVDKAKSMAELALAINTRVLATAHSTNIGDDADHEKEFRINKVLQKLNLAERLRFTIDPQRTTAYNFTSSDIDTDEI